MRTRPVFARVFARDRTRSLGNGARFGASGMSIWCTVQLWVLHKEGRFTLPAIAAIDRNRGMRWHLVNSFPNLGREHFGVRGVRSCSCSTPESNAAAIAAAAVPTPPTWRLPMPRGRRQKPGSGSPAPSDFFPVVSGDESVLLFNSAQKFYNAVFFSKKVNNKWSSPVNITPEIQSDGNQYCSSLSFYGTELYLRVEDNFDADLMVAKYENGIWTKSKSLGKNINTKFWEGNACVSKDGKTLFFSSNKPGGFGALDIYKSLRQPNGDWGIPVNLGNVINSEFNDDAPFITEDGKRLYFVSQGHQTMGGYDIFYSELDNIGKWMEPVNLGYPINTTDDELFFCPVKNGAVAYVGKYSKTGYGYEDIVRMQLVPEELIAAKPSKEEPKNQDKNTKQNEPSTDLAVNKLPSNFEKNLIETDSTTKAKERIVIRCIFFDFNSSALTIKAKKELDYLFIIMKNTPELKLEFSGNTDALGSDEYNLSLSAQRANNAKTYLINKGVQAERISTKGVGKKNYIAVNNNPDGSDNPEGRVFNRRVDFRIPEAINKSIIIEEVKVPEKLQIRNGESNP